MLNLHNIVRGAIQVVNPDVTAIYLQAIAPVTNPDGSMMPAYTSPYPVQAQIQPPSSRDLRHIDYLNLQGVIRTMYVYSNPQSLNRVAARGGDLFMVPQWQPHAVFDSGGQIVLNSSGTWVLAGAPLDLWLVTYVDEFYDVGALGWSKLYVTLQADGRQIVLNSNRLPVLNSQGGLVTSQ